MPFSIPPTKAIHSTIPVISPPSENLLSHCQPYCVIAAPYFPVEPVHSSLTSSENIETSPLIILDKEPGVIIVTPTLGPANFSI